MAASPHDTERDVKARKLRDYCGREDSKLLLLKFCVACLDHPERIRDALTGAFDLASVVADHKRAMVFLENCRVEAQAALHLCEQVHIELDKIDQRIDRQNAIMEESARKLRWIINKLAAIADAAKLRKEGA